MPAFWPDYPKSFYPQFGGNADAQIRAIRDYLLTLRGGPSPGSEHASRRTDQTEGRKGGQRRERQEAVGQRAQTLLPPIAAPPAPHCLPGLRAQSRRPL